MKLDICASLVESISEGHTIIPPEMCRGEITTFSEATDVFAVSVLLSEMQMTSGSAPQNALIQQGFSLNPASRPTLKDIENSVLLLSRQPIRSHTLDEAEIVLSSAEERYVCGVCGELMLNASNLAPCNHKLCSPCVLRLRHPNCPFCQDPIDIEKSGTDHFVQSGAADVEIRCLKCEFKMKAGSFRTHTCRRALRPPKAATDADIIKTLEVFIAQGVVVDEVVLKNSLSITDITIKYIAICCPKLKTLRIDGCPKITGSMLGLIGQGCKELTSLQLKNMTDLTDGAVLSLLLPNFYNFDQYTLVSDVVLENCVGITDVSVKYVAMSCPKLKTLRMSGCPKITGSSLVLIGAVCKELTTLQLNNMMALTDAAVVAFLKSNGLLITSISLAGCSKITDAAVIAIAENLARLEALNIAGVGSITDLAIEQLWLKSSRLKSLNVSHNEKITDKAMCRMPTHICYQLRLLSVEGNWGITDESMKRIFRSSSSLTVLNVSYTEVSDDAMMELLGRCANIEVLDITYAEDISDYSMVKIVGMSPELRSLKIGGTCVSDVTLQRLAEACHKLTELNVWSNNFVTDEGMASVASQCPEVEVLEINGTAKITDRSMERFARATNLRVLNVGNTKGRVTDKSIGKIVEANDHCLELLNVGLTDGQITQNVLQLACERGHPLIVIVQDKD